MRLLAFLFLILLTAVPAQAQSPQAEAVVEGWIATQQRAARSMRSVGCREESTRRIDSPKGAREIETRARLRTHLNPFDVDRDIYHVVVNGREVPTDEQGRALRFLRHSRGERGLLDWTGPHGLLLDRYRLDGPPQPAERGTVRVELEGLPGDRDERLTLWFDPRAPRLLRSRLLTRHPGDPTPLVVETDYRRVRGLDLPTRRHVEGTMQVRKRTRSFTLHYKQEVAYHDYRFER